MGAFVEGAFPTAKRGRWRYSHSLHALKEEMEKTTKPLRHGGYKMSDESSVSVHHPVKKAGNDRQILRFCISYYWDTNVLGDDFDCI